MNVYVWERIERASNNYHPQGGVVVFANTLEEAIDMAAQKGALIANDELPDEIRTTKGKKAIYIMPDAGCC